MAATRENPRSSRYGKFDLYLITPALANQYYKDAKPRVRLRPHKGIRQGERDRTQFGRVRES
jgi:hypothetical protein